MVVYNLGMTFTPIVSFKLHEKLCGSQGQGIWDLAAKLEVAFCLKPEKKVRHLQGLMLA